MKLRKLLVPHDFSAHADAALKAAVELCAGGRITLLNVISPATTMTDLPLAGPGVYVDPTDLIQGARKELERRGAKYAGKPGAPRFEYKVEIGNPHQRIIEAGNRADAIVMSTAGRSGLAHLLIGSVAERVVRHATVPVLTIRPKAKRPAGKKAKRG